MESENQGSTPHPQVNRFDALWPVLAAVALSAAGWVIIVLAIPPSQQDFPLGDDWAFSHSFLDFVTGQGLNYRQFAAMPQLGQWLWAVPFYLVFSPSQFSLRLSTIVLGWLGLIAVYDLFRQEGLSPRRAGFLAAVLGLNPLWFQLQGTFMTDVPALSFSLIALACYGRVIIGARQAWLALALVTAVLGAISRQNAVVAPVVAAYLGWRRQHPGSLAWAAGVLVPIGVGIGAHFWFVSRSDVLRPAFRPQPLELAMISPFLILHTCGLMSLPAIALRPWPRSPGLLIATFTYMVGMAIYLGNNSAVIPSFDKSSYYPYTVPILSPFGPFACHFEVGLGPILLPQLARQVLTLLGCIGGAYLLAAVADAPQDGYRSSPILCFTALQLALLYVAPSFYDRYFLVLLPGALLLMGGRAASVPATRSQWCIASAMLLAGAVFSVCLMHDWLSWNCARWDLGRLALSDGIDPSDVEGGFEWDGWYAPPDRSKLSLQDTVNQQPNRMVLHFTRSNFRNVRGRFAIGFIRFALSDFAEAPPYVRVRNHTDLTLWTNPGREPMFLFEGQAKPPEAARQK